LIRPKPTRIAAPSEEEEEEEVGFITKKFVTKHGHMNVKFI